MSKTDDSVTIPDFKVLVAMAAFAPDEVIEKCREFTETLTEKSTTLTVAQILIASTIQNGRRPSER